MKRKSGTGSSKREQVVGVELGLKMQQNNNNHDANNGGPFLNGYKYHNNTSIITDNATTKTSSENCPTNLSNVVSDNACTTQSPSVVTTFDVPSSYYYSTSSNINPFFKPSSGGMATTTMGFPFTATQWKELERQAMIYKYMMASLPVPPDLLYSSFPTNFLPSSAFTPASYFIGRYGSGVSVRWSGNSKDAEPGRCKRTDGKKWRCSRDVAPNSKYCERHMHRGRPRSRKHVEHQLQQQNNQAHTLPDLHTNNKANKDNLTRKTRLNDQSNGSCVVQPSKDPIFDQSMVTNAIPFEGSRNFAWSDEQQWNHVMETNMNSSLFHHQLEGGPLNLNANGGLSGQTDLSLLERPLFDAWSMGVPETKDNLNKFPLSSSNCGQGNVDEEMCHIHMGLGLIDSWVSSTTTTPGGPLAEVLRPKTASNPSMSDARETDFITPPATAVSSPSGVLQKTLATFSDSSGSNSPVCHNSNINSDMPFHWLN